MKPTTPQAMTQAASMKPPYGEPAKRPPAGPAAAPPAPAAAAVRAEPDGQRLAQRRHSDDLESRHHGASRAVAGGHDGPRETGAGRAPPARAPPPRRPRP